MYRHKTESNPQNHDLESYQLSRQEKKKGLIKGLTGEMNGERYESRRTKNNWCENPKGKLETNKWKLLIFF